MGWEKHSSRHIDLRTLRHGVTAGGADLQVLARMGDATAKRHAEYIAQAEAALATMPAVGVAVGLAPGQCRSLVAVVNEAMIQGTHRHLGLSGSEMRNVYAALRSLQGAIDA